MGNAEKDVGKYFIYVFQSEESTALRLLKAMNNVYNKYNFFKSDDSSQKQQFYSQMIDTFVLNLPVALNVILNLCNNSNLRCEALKLVAVTLVKHFDYNYDDVLKMLLTLPVSVSDWGQSKSGIFFNICSIQLEKTG